MKLFAGLAAGAASGRAGFVQARHGGRPRDRRTRDKYSTIITSKKSFSAMSSMARFAAQHDRAEAQVSLALASAAAAAGSRPTQGIAELLAPALPEYPAWSRSLVLGSLQAGTAAVWQHVHGDPCSLELTARLLEHTHAPAPNSAEVAAAAAAMQSALRLCLQLDGKVAVTLQRQPELAAECWWLQHSPAARG